MHRLEERMTIAIARPVSPAINRCELTHLDREPIDLHRAADQHEAYERCLAELGCRVVRVPAEPELPDSVFVEDTAVVVDELAVMTRPGAVSRRAETASVARVLAEFRPLATIEAPGTLDGGDVLRVGRRFFVGQTGRSDRTGAAMLRALLEPHGYTVEAVPVTGCLHLKSAVSQVAAGAVLVNPLWVDATAFAPLRVVEVDPGEPAAANTLVLGGTVVAAVAYPRTAARLEALGLRVVRLDMSELAKAEGALTCCSLLLAD
jgi:dimethylargininase